MLSLADIIRASGGGLLPYSLDEGRPGDGLLQRNEMERCWCHFCGCIE